MSRSDMDVPPSSSGGAPVLNYAGPAYPHLRHNYLAHAIEGSLFIGGLTFVNQTTLLPTIVHELHGPTILVSLMPMIMSIGFLTPPIFTAHWISRLNRYMPMLVITGVFQRLPYLLAAMALFFAADSIPMLALAAVVLAPFGSGLMGGVSTCGWQQMFANTVPENQRSSLFSWRYVGGSLIGIVAGYVAKITLTAYPSTTGYAVLHLMAFATIMASFAVFCTIREPRVTPYPATAGLGLIQNIRAMPGLVRRDKPFAMFLLARFFRNGVFILAPFVAIHARSVLGAPEEFLGQLAVVQMIGAIVGNIFSGYVGDRLGAKIVMLVSIMVLVVVSIWAPLAHTSVQFQCILFLYGFGYFASEVGNMSLCLELCRLEQRSSYLAIGSLINLPAMFLASIVGTLLWEPGHHFGQVAILSMVWLTLAILFLLPVRDPWQTRQQQFSAAPGERVAFPSESADLDL